MVGEAGFHVHGWEEVWEFEENRDIFKIYDLDGKLSTKSHTHL
jgi:hypothetical protein